MAITLPIKTVAYKGSKRKLVSQIVDLALEVGATCAFDGFSGSGIVSAALRHNGLKVVANDLNSSSYIFGRVFLEGYDPEVVARHLAVINDLKGHKGWVSDNYAGTVRRKVRGQQGEFERPLGLLMANAMKIDAARDYIEGVAGLTPRDKNALVFSTIKGCDSVFNNSNDQKSALKEWSNKSLQQVVFEAPTLIRGPVGEQLRGDVFDLEIPSCDFVYLDPPYTHGVLYAACYHLSNSLALWDKAPLNDSYAIPRPERAVFRKKAPGAFYSKKRIQTDFNRLLEKYKSPRVVLSYSDAPRNTIKIDELVSLCRGHGSVTVRDIEHQICAQYKSQQKRSTKLKEYFIIIDT